ncbi:MAG: alkaline phosphatase [Bacteroidales bacterium]
MKKTVLILLFAIIHISLFSQTQPKNVIIVSIPGMGFNHAKLLNYQNPEKDVWDTFTTQYGVTTYPAYSHVITEDKDVQYFTGDYHTSRIWSDTAYVSDFTTDPSSASTAIATGVKSGHKTVGVDIDSTALETILERAHTLHKSTGIITDLPLSHCGAASFAAHVPSNEDTLAVLTQLLQSNLDVMIGAGNPYFNNDRQEVTHPNFSYFPESYWTALKNGESDYAPNIDAENPWSLLELFAEAQDSACNRLLYVPPTFDAINFKTSEDVISVAPEFWQLTELGLDHLAENEHGFSVVVETGAVDYASRLNSSDKTFFALQSAYLTIETIINWVEANSSWDETVLVVTGTYETGFITGDDFDPEQSGPEYYTETIHVEDPETSSIPNINFQTSTPTRFATPFFAKGMGDTVFSHFTDQEDFVYGPVINNSEIGQACFRLLPLPDESIAKPKNIILMINDGMGFNQMKLGEYFTGEKQAYQNFPVALSMSTYPLATNEATEKVQHWNNSYESRLAWTDKHYLWGRNNATCSAASGTAIASGTKTYYYCMGVDKDGNAVNTIARHSKALGKSVGIVSTKSIFDATPAAFFANNISRNNYGEITRQLLIESKIDVLIGADHPEYNVNAEITGSPDYDDMGGEDFWHEINAGNTVFSTPSNSGWTEVQDCNRDGIRDPWTLIEDSADFDYFMTHDTINRMLGIMKVAYSPQVERSGTDKQSVHFDDWNTNVPKLWQTSRAALNLLKDNPNGFFTMFEGAALDRAGHTREKGRMIEEQIIFDEAVDSVIAWIEKNGGWEDNLLIVTADHETGFVAHPDFETDSILLNHHEVIDNGAGTMPGFSFFAGDHTNQLVPFFAKGAGSEVFNTYADEQDFVRGKFLTNSEIAQGLFYLWDGTPGTIINNKPIIVTDGPIIEDVELILGQDTTFTVAQDFVEDVEDSDLTYTLTTRPSWIDADMNTLTFDAYPQQRTGRFNIRFDITDGATTGSGVSASAFFYVKVSDITGNHDISHTENRIYPNPVNKELTVTVESGNGTVTLYNQNGVEVYTKQVRNTNILTIPVTDLQTGVYTITITEDKMSTHQAIIIQ